MAPAQRDRLMEHIMMSASPDSDAPAIRWSAAAEAGFVGGIVYLMIALLFIPLFIGGTVWGVIRMIAAIVLGSGVLPPPDTFDVGVVLTGTVLHLLLATVYGAILAVIVNGSGRGAALLVGALFGLVLYIVNFYVFTGVFPWFAAARTWVTVLTHVGFGVAVAWSYTAIAVTPRRSWSAER